jgi:predicted nucleic acid-binding protein
MTKRNDRFVFDTNILVSALLIAESKPGLAVYVGLSKGTILLSDALIRELYEVMSR